MLHCAYSYVRERYVPYHVYPEYRYGPNDFEGYSYFDQIVIDSSDVVKDLENRIFRRVIDLKGEFQQEQMEHLIINKLY